MGIENRHRGPAQADAILFCQAAQPDLRLATADLSFLLTRGYSTDSALKLVGDRFRLKVRQRLAVGRSACSDQNRNRRLEKEVHPRNLRGATLLVDAFNLIILLESAMSGGFVFRGRDGCFRDLAGIHGSYRRVAETGLALRVAGEAMRGFGVAKVRWFLDAPVSHSGHLAALIRALGEGLGLDWTTELIFNPDLALSSAEGVVVSSDGWILDRAGSWANLASFIIGEKIENSAVVDLNPDQV